MARSVFSKMSRVGFSIGKTAALFAGLVVVLVLMLGITGQVNDAVAPSRAAADLVGGQQQPVGELWNRTELFFGSEKPDGSKVTKREFDRFVDRKATPRFPDGLTLLTGYGQFRESSGRIVEEKSRVLILLYPLDDADAEIEEIREAYEREFEQESVLRTDSQERVSF